MKYIYCLILLLSTLNSFARELYSDEFVRLPNDSYKLIILKDIKLNDSRATVKFFKGKIVKTLPTRDDLFYCELTNAREDNRKIDLEVGNIFRFSDEDGSYWDHYFSGRIWRKKFFIWDNDDVQYFSCNDTASYLNRIDSDGVRYKNIRKAVGSYLKIIVD